MKKRSDVQQIPQSLVKGILQVIKCLFNQD